MQQTEVQLGLESDAPEEKKEFARQLMRKQIINSLTDTFKQRACEIHHKYVQNSIVQSDHTTPTPKFGTPHIPTPLQRKLTSPRAWEKEEEEEEEAKDPALVMIGDEDDEAYGL